MYIVNIYSFKNKFTNCFYFCQMAFVFIIIVSHILKKFSLFFMKRKLFIHFNLIPKVSIIANFYNILIAMIC